MPTTCDIDHDAIIHQIATIAQRCAADIILPGNKDIHTMRDSHRRRTWICRHAVEYQPGCHNNITHNFTIQGHNIFGSSLLDIRHQGCMIIIILHHGRYRATIEPVHAITRRIQESMRVLQRITHPPVNLGMAAVIAEDRQHTRSEQCHRYHRWTQRHGQSMLDDVHTQWIADTWKDRILSKVAGDEQTVALFRHGYPDKGYTIPMPSHHEHLAWCRQHQQALHRMIPSQH